jgi:hypothetical protein
LPLPIPPASTCCCSTMAPFIKPNRHASPQCRPSVLTPLCPGVKSDRAALARSQRLASHFHPYHPGRTLHAALHAPPSVLSDQLALLNWLSVSARRYSFSEWPIFIKKPYEIIDIVVIEIRDEE